MRNVSGVAAAILVVVLGGCATAPASSPQSTRTGPQVRVSQEEFLYTRLGGLEAIKAVVDDFVARVAGDTRINRFFAPAMKDPNEIADFKQKLVDQICQATGGPCTYKGKDMHHAHAGMGITGADFDAMMSDLTATLVSLKVKERDKNELMAALLPMKADIVEGTP
jgi:hemoglobin